MKALTYVIVRLENRLLPRDGVGKEESVFFQTGEQSRCGRPGVLIPLVIEIV